MRLIVDSNRIISALIKGGLSRTIITSRNIEFYTLEYVVEEIKKYMDYIVRKSKMTDKEIDLLFTLFIQKITIVPDEKIKPKMKPAIKVMKDIDIRDSPILACALAISNDGIWTEDRHFDKQNIAKVWKTKDLVNYIKKGGT